MVTDSLLVTRFDNVTFDSQTGRNPMSENLTTRGMLQQINTRLGRVEVGTSEFRRELAPAVAQFRDEFTQIRKVPSAALAQVRSESASALAQLRDEMNARFDRVYGILVSVLIGVGALVIGVAGLWIKL